MLEPMAGAARRLIVLGVIVGLMAACGSESRPPSPPPIDLVAGGTVTSSYTGDGPKVAIIGDSLTARSWKATYDALTNDYSVMVAALVGEGYDGGPISEEVGSPPILPDTADTYAKTHPAVAVLALGTNDAWNSSRDLGRALLQMDAMVKELKPACLVGVTIPESSSAIHWHPDRARALNQAMRSWADEIVDWEKISSEPGMLNPIDHIHATVLGEKRRVAAVADAVRACT